MSKILNYQENGQLVPGVHTIELDLLIKEYGYNDLRQELITGLKMALVDLKTVGCKIVFIDGSFVTKKTDPKDYDACWVEEGVDFIELKKEYPLFFDFADKRDNQKAYYKGEWMPATAPAKLIPTFPYFQSYFQFFQLDKDDNRKGIISIKL